MTHFACISLPYQGHLNPMAALARELVRRGHRATFFHVADVAPLVARFDLPFLRLGAASHPPGWLEGATRNMGRVQGMCGLLPVMRDIASMTAMFCDELPRALRALGIDMIIADQFEAAGGMVAYHVGLPFVSLAAALPLNWEPGVPSPFVGWSYGETRWHQARNIASAFGAKKVMAPIGDVIDAVATKWRLGRGRQIEHYMSGFAQISQLVPTLDFPRRELIGCFHYCGPLRDRRETADTVLSPSRRRRAFASLGTLQGHRIDLFEQIAQATRACGLDLTIAHGGRMAPADAARLSRHADVYAFVPQDHVLAAADIAILHGGMNTVLDAAAQGVPMIVMPLAFEQAAIASRVKRSGAGRICRSRGRHLPAMIRDVAETSSYAAAAATIRDEIRTAGGVRRAADIVEYVAETGRPYLNAQGAKRACRRVG